MTDQYRDYGYNTLEPGNGDSGRRLAEKIMSIIRCFPDIKTICDLGCGNGYISSRLASLGYTITGIDASETGIALAQERLAAHNVKFICAKIDKKLVNVIGSKCYDLVLSSDVIEHLYRPDDLVEVANVLLRPRGRILIGTPYHGYLKNMALSILDKWDDHHTVRWEGDHIKFFSVKTLRSLVEAHDYADTHFYYYGRLPLFWKNMLCLARKRS